MENQSFSPAEPQSPLEPLTPQALPLEPVKKNNNLLMMTGAIIFVATVGAGAYFLGMSNGKNNNAVQLISEQPLTASPATDLTATWKTYDNAPDHFSIKLPSDWQGKEAMLGMYFTQADEGKLTKEQKTIAGGSYRTLEVSVFKDAAQPNYDLHCKAPLLNRESANPTISHTSPISGVEQFVQSSGTMAHSTAPNIQFWGSTVCFMKDGVDYEFFYNNYGQTSSDPLFDQILSTVKFTDQKQTSVTSTSVACANQKLGVRLSLPDQTWTCATTNDGYTTAISSPKFAVTISSLGRDNYCSPPDTDPNSPRYNPDLNSCVVTPFVANQTVNTELFTSYGVDKEIFGMIGQSASVSVSLKDQSIKQFSEQDKTVIKSLLESIKKSS